MRILLIRHGATRGNLEKRYIGVTDEPLCPEGIAELDSLHYPRPEIVFTSPLLRCRQTVQVLFPGTEPVVVEELRESDFGSFENHTWQELSGDPDYQAWLDSGGLLPFPGGDSRESFRERCLAAWEKISGILASVKETREDEIAAVVTHGGVIMNLMESLSGRPGSFYDWHLPNGGCWSLPEMERFQT